MSEDIYTCRCGAAGDLGELTEHILEKFKSSEDDQDHGIVEMEIEPDNIVEARQSWQRRTEIQHRLADLLEAPISDIRDAILGA